MTRLAAILLLLCGCAPERAVAPKSASRAAQVTAVAPPAATVVNPRTMTLTVFAGSDRVFGVATATNPSGPWTTLWERPNEFIYPSVTFDVYLTEQQRFYRRFSR